MLVRVRQIGPGHGVVQYQGRVQVLRGPPMRRIHRAMENCLRRIPVPSVALGVIRMARRWLHRNGLLTDRRAS